jgi:hypothetical protein
MLRFLGYFLTCVVLGVAIAGGAGCQPAKNDAVAQPGFLVKEMDNGSFLFEANPKAANKADIQAFLHELNSLMQANPKLEVRSVVPVRAGSYSVGDSRNPSSREYYSILVFTGPKGEPRPQPRDKAKE